MVGHSRRIAGTVDGRNPQRTVGDSEVGRLSGHRHLRPGASTIVGEPGVGRTFEIDVAVYVALSGCGKRHRHPKLIGWNQRTWQGSRDGPRSPAIVGADHVVATTAECRRWHECEGNSDLWSEHLQTEDRTWWDSRTIVKRSAFRSFAGSGGGRSLIQGCGRRGASGGGH